MKTNTELLCIALGWQGGTVHQVSAETGLTVSQIVETDRKQPRGDKYAQGWFAARTCSLDHNQKVNFPKARKDLDFWMGVAQGQDSLEQYPNL